MGTATKTRASTNISDFYDFLRYERWRFPVKKFYRPAVENKRGIEVGGPSPVFKTSLPLYQFVGELDGVNFASDTVWEGHIEAGARFKHSDDALGMQFIADATDLNHVPTAAYDFVFSSNCLEHVANPIKALREWRRVMKSRGFLVLVLPNRKFNFDHRRQVTSFDHLVQDFTQDTAEDDLTHLAEILEFHDLSLDPPAGSLAQFKERSLRNFENRTLHHHVFDVPLMKRMLDYTQFEVLHTARTRSDLFALARSND